MTKVLLFFGILLILFACEPLTETFDDYSCIKYQANKIKDIPVPDSGIKVMTWNIRFGAGRILWFGESCGKRVIMTKEETILHLDSLAAKINEIKPQILMLEEVDISSKRSAYIDQIQYLLDKTHLNYGVYSSDWKSQFIPSDGLGKMDDGQGILSVWQLEDIQRHDLPLRGDIDALTKYFYKRYCIVSAKVKAPGIDNLYAMALHFVAFSVDDTKQKHVAKLMEIVNKMNAENKKFILGGDFNLLPPNAKQTDYCIEDMCTWESYHQPGDDPQHKEGSYYTPEITWMQDVFDNLKPSLALSDYALNPVKYYTHGTNPELFWDRTIDYLFSNSDWVTNSHKVHQEAWHISDHAPVVATWRVK